MAQSQHAWAAGFLDGEGHFALKTRTAAYSRACSRLACVNVAQINRKPLEVLADLYGGQITSRSLTSSGNQIWHWDLWRPADIAYLVEKISPYLVLKQEEALLVARYAGTVGKAGRRLSSEQIDEREQIIGEFDTAKVRA